MTRPGDKLSWTKRHSLLSNTSLVGSTISSNEKSGSKLVRRQYHRQHKNDQAASPLIDPEYGEHAPSSPLSISTMPDIPESRRGSLPALGKRSSNALESLRGVMRGTNYDDISPDAIGEPLSAASTATPSLFSDANAFVDGHPPARKVLLHGEVQTSASMFRKKKEHLVLTESHILRYKSQAKAAEAWRAIPLPGGRPAHIKHGSMTSVSSLSDKQTISESSGEKDGRVSLRQVVAVQKVDDGKPYFALEIAYLDDDSGNAACLTLQFNNPDERDLWCKSIRSKSKEACAHRQRPMSAANIEHAARVVEREQDYDPAECAIYKIVHRQSASKSGRTSAEDITKIASTVCLLAIGVHKVHLIQLAKPAGRMASPSIPPGTSQASYGILTLMAIRVSGVDDSFELTFRLPLQKPKQLFLASHASHEIVARLQRVENELRPECGRPLYKLNVPQEVSALLSPPAEAQGEHSGIDRTMAAYCAAYGVNPTNVRYSIDYECEDAPKFQLLPPADPRRPNYSPLALLAIMRALRYNESFGSISFAGISLDSLNGLHDVHGNEHVCTRTKRGTPIKMPMEELENASLLVQEVRALAAASKKLRRMDFSNTIADGLDTTESDVLDEEPSNKVPDIGCGFVEALVPLCRQQTTNVDWICLNGIRLSDRDMDYLVGAAVDKLCHFRALELNRCGLNDRSMGLILDALRAQDNTIEAIEIGGNTARLDPTTFDSQLSVFGFIRKLNLSYVTRTSGNDALLSAETLLTWRLQELRFSGTTLNQATVDAVATYLAHPQSLTLHELYFDNSYLSGGDVATLLMSLSHDVGQHRDLHLDISQNRLTKDLDKVTKAIAKGLTPSKLSMRAIEYREESLFRKMLAALTANKTITYLDMSQTALPGNASDDTCRALGKLLAENDALLELDISGENSRLASSKFGPGINDALLGLKKNKSLQRFRVERQKLGLQGASTLAEVLKENKVLRELYCDHNEIPLHGLTDLVNSLIENTTLVYLPPMEDGRKAAFKSAEDTMKAISDLESPASPASPSKTSPSRANTSGMKRGLASMRRSAARTASAYTPSFPALPTYSRSAATSSTPSSSFSVNRPINRARNSSQSAGASGPSPFVAPAISFSIQDIQTTQRLLAEQWDRQVYRLEQYLNRNWCLLHDIPVAMEVEDEKFERPASVGSMSKILEQVRLDSTPRAEKPGYFVDGEGKNLLSLLDAINYSNVSIKDTTNVSIADSCGTPNVIASLPAQVVEDKNLSFKHFLLHSDSSSEDNMSNEDVSLSAGIDKKKKDSNVKTRRNPRPLRIDTSLEKLDGPDTPTQPVFTA